MGEPCPPKNGTCGGGADFETYASTGCESGFVFNGSICTRSAAFQNRCNEPTGYDSATCSCPDGTSTSPIIIDVLKSIDLDFKESRRVDQYGNRFRYRAKVKDTHDAQLGRWAWDVFLLVK